jgi:hypothetical protein
MKWRWLAVVGLSFVLSACDTFNPCSSPGVIGPAQCYHYLTIADKNLQTGELRGTVARSVVKEDASKLFNFYTEKEYPSWMFNFRVPDSELASLNVGDSYMFVSEINQSDLKRCTTDECNKAAKHLSQFEKH